MTASEYMGKVKALADAMAAAGSPLRDDEVIDHMLTGLGRPYNPIAASLQVATTAVSLSAFYSMVLNYEALQLSQEADDDSWSSSANSVSRSGPTGAGTGRPRTQETGRPSGGYQPQQGGQDRRYNGGGGGNTGRNNLGGNYSRNNGGTNNGRNGRNNGRRSRPRCQLCGYWGHEAADCRNRFDQDYYPEHSRSANHASTSNTEAPHWLVDSGATDHLTSDLDRLHVRERYGGKDHVQVANGTGLSISHIGHSNLAGSSLRLNNVLHVPHINQHLLSVHRLVSDNNIFIEFHKHFFLVKDKGTRRILLRGRSQGGLYPLPFSRASPSSTRHASSSVRIKSSQWHQRLGHPSKNVVSSIVRNNGLVCLSSDNTPLVCDACQRAKSHQLPYHLSSHVSTMPLELIHSDVWGPARASSGGYKYYVSFIDVYSRFCWIYLLKYKRLMLSVF
jgi:histone deacetylase 1/2